MFVERRLPERIAARLPSQPVPRPAAGFRRLAKAALAALILAGALIVAVAEFPDRIRAVVPPQLAQLLPPALPDRAAIQAAYWLDQNWSTEDRHWFHHASQGTATFPVPYAWFVALEQPGIRLFTEPGLLADSAYLERFGFLPSPKSIRADERDVAPLWLLRTRPTPAGAEPAPESVSACARRRWRISTACRSVSRD